MAYDPRAATDRHHAPAPSGIHRRCGHCQQPAPGYDCLPERSWQFVPLWGIPTCLRYAPRRVNCAQHGVVVEHIPWSDGKRPVTCGLIAFLARWARRMSWQETARSRIEPMKKVARMLRAHEDLILNWFRAEKEKSPVARWRVCQGFCVNILPQLRFDRAPSLRTAGAD